MRIHANTLNENDIYLAAHHARVQIVTLEPHGSRKRDHAFDVKLEGESRRRPNGGASGRDYGSGYAATWDQWGVFLSILFDIDPSVSTPYDVDRYAFDSRTRGRFEVPSPVGTGYSSNANVVNVRNYRGEPIHRLGADYWPDDAHGDHTFRFAGVPRQQSCTKCSAIQAW